MGTPVLLLAAGLGTRLRPLTDWLPKPLLPIGDRPALDHILAGVRPLDGPVVVNAHHRPADLRAFLEASARDVILSEEPDILGTAGGLRQAGGSLGPGDVVVWNGDILSSLDPVALVAAHRAGETRDATLALRGLPAGEGNVGTDERGRIVRLRGESVAPGEVRGGAFLGVHVVGEGLRGGLPTKGCLVGDVYLPALRAGRALRTFEASGAWHDIGTVNEYAAACFAWLGARATGSYLGSRALVSARVSLRRSIIGRGAEVTGEGVVERCVVWPGAKLEAPCKCSVVTPFGVVPFTE